MFANKRALLIGNGINFLDDKQSLSWGDLLGEINKPQNNINIDFDNPFKPFPLAFDELQHTTAGNDGIKRNLRGLKKTIREAFEKTLRKTSEKNTGKDTGNNTEDKTEDITGNKTYHKQIVGLGYSDILTTNYEYGLELALDANFSNAAIKKKLALNNAEIKHSLKRGYEFIKKRLKYRYIINNTRIWHIHGELCDNRTHTNEKTYPEQSILIGYEQYAEYLTLIQEKIKGTKTERSDTLAKRILNNENTNRYWMDKFFTHDLDIIGQGLDFAENHLWWLIRYRAELIKNNTNLNISNTIRYYYADFENEPKITFGEDSKLEDLIEAWCKTQKAKAVADLLKAFNVEVVPVKCKNYKELYDEFISRFY